jgi:hypothetical protein
VFEASAVTWRGDSGTPCACCFAPGERKLRLLPIPGGVVGRRKAVYFVTGGVRLRGVTIPRFCKATKTKDCPSAEEILRDGLSPRRLIEAVVIILIGAAIGAGLGALIGDWTTGCIAGAACSSLFLPSFRR